jgi:hypothetical protein
MKRSPRMADDRSRFPPPAEPHRSTADLRTFSSFAHLDEVIKNVCSTGLADWRSGSIQRPQPHRYQRYQVKPHNLAGAFRTRLACGAFRRLSGNGLGCARQFSKLENQTCDDAPSDFITSPLVDGENVPNPKTWLQVKDGF